MEAGLRVAFLGLLVRAVRVHVAMREDGITGHRVIPKECGDLGISRPTWRAENIPRRRSARSLVPRDDRKRRSMQIS